MREAWHKTTIGILISQVSQVVPYSYCDIKFGMSLFRDAHHYFSMVSKNIESYSEVAPMTIAFFITM